MTRGDGVGQSLERREVIHRCVLDVATEPDRPLRIRARVGLMLPVRHLRFLISKHSISTKCLMNCSLRRAGREGKRGIYLLEETCLRSLIDTHYWADSFCFDRS